MSPPRWHREGGKHHEQTWVHDCSPSREPAATSPGMAIAEQLKHTCEQLALTKWYPGRATLANVVDLGKLKRQP